MSEWKWRTVFIAAATLLPGLVAILLIVARSARNGPTNFSWDGAGALVSGSLLAIALLRWRYFTVWSLPALGIFLGSGLPMLADLLPAGSTGIFSLWWIAGTVVVASFLMRPLQEARPLPRSLWLLLAIVLVLQPWSLLIMSLVLLPVASALRLAPIHGGRAALVAATALYWPVTSFFDPAYGVLIWTESSNVALLMSLLPAFLLLIVVPAGLLFARPTGKQAFALVAPVALGLLAGEIGRSVLFAGTGRGAYDGAMWLLRGGAIAQYTLLLTWVLLACRWYAERPARTLSGESPVAPSAKFVL